MHHIYKYIPVIYKFLTISDNNNNKETWKYFVIIKLQPNRYNNIFFH